MPPEPPEDRRRQRFEQLYAATHDNILGYLLRRVDDPQDAADLLGETYLIAWRRLDAVPSGDQARLWLYGVARNLLANHWRTERRRSDLAARLRADPPMPQLMPDGDLARIAAAFRTLPDADQELLALVGWEGLDHAQIATVLGVSRNAVRIRLHRARRRFGQALGDGTFHSPLTPLVPGERA